MRRWTLISIMGVGLVTGSLRAIGQDVPQLSQKGMAIFQEVLAGDEERLPEALGYMEQARTVDGTQIYNLYTLGRAYFYEAVTQNRREALVKAEEVFARVIELQCLHRVLRAQQPEAFPKLRPAKRPWARVFSMPARPAIRRMS